MTPDAVVAMKINQQAKIETVIFHLSGLVLSTKLSLCRKSVVENPASEREQKADGALAQVSSFV